MTADSPSPGLSDAQYRTAIAEVLNRIESTVDRWLQSDEADIDSERSGNMLTLTLPNRSQLIINAQPPLHELWLAARRGGYHFKHTDGQWVDTRHQLEFFALLSDCASEQAGTALTF